MSDAESQLVLGLGGAVAALSADACTRCEEVFRDWWRERPVIARLDWLAAALDTLAGLHPSPGRLTDLFADGLGLAERKGHRMGHPKITMWRRIGAALELPADVVESLLSALTEAVGATSVDALARCGVKSIAIVSLRESSAMTAARELELRTRASVFVVGSLVADDQTRRAGNADLILYVWAASTHAAYRALDRWRDRLEYVQGTGASSVVIAAERWAARRLTEQEQH